MSLNCKPGDIAILIRDQVVAGPSSMCASNVTIVQSGAVVTVTKLQYCESDPVWLIEEPIPRTCQCVHGGRFRLLVRGLSDSNLRPLRDPGDDVQTDNPVTIKEPDEVF